MSDKGWICPKCEAVYAPFVPNCMKCIGKAKAPADRPRRNDPLRGYGDGVHCASGIHPSAGHKPR